MRYIVMFCVVCCIVPAVAAETIHLANGNSIEGTIVSQDSDAVVVEYNLGSGTARTKIPSYQITSITRSLVNKSDNPIGLTAPFQPSGAIPGACLFYERQFGVGIEIDPQFYAQFPARIGEHVLSCTQDKQELPYTVTIDVVPYSAAKRAVFKAAFAGTQDPFGQRMPEGERGRKTQYANAFFEGWGVVYEFEPLNKSMHRYILFPKSNEPFAVHLTFDVPFRSRRETGGSIRAMLEAVRLPLEEMRAESAREKEKEKKQSKQNSAKKLAPKEKKLMGAAGAVFIVFLIMAIYRAAKNRSMNTKKKPVGRGVAKEKNARACSHFARKEAPGFSVARAEILTEAHMRKEFPGFIHEQKGPYSFFYDASGTCVPNMMHAVDAAYTEFHESFSGLMNRTSNQMRVIIFSEYARYQAFAASVHEQLAHTAGFYDARSRRLVLLDSGKSAVIRPVISASSSSPGSMVAHHAYALGRFLAVVENSTSQRIARVMKHEAITQIIYERGVMSAAGFDIWLYEGIAAFFSVSAAGSRDRAAAGLAQSAYLEGTALSIADLFMLSERGAFYAQDAKKVCAAYAQSWLVVFYLMRTHRDGFFTYLESACSRKAAAAYGKARMKLFEEHIGMGFDCFDEQLRAFAAEITSP